MVEPVSNEVDFSLIIACYRDAPHLFANTMALDRFLGATRFRYEIIFVEDCSGDGTADEVRRCVQSLRSKGVAVEALFHSANTGRGRAVTDGIRMARGTVACYIDIDLEHMLDGILPMMCRIQDGLADVMVGRRVIANPWAKPLRVLASWVYRGIVHSAVDLPVSDTEAGLKLFHRAKILPVLDETENPGWFWDTEIVHRAARRGLRVGEHRILFNEDRNKKSTVRIIPDTWAYLKALKIYRASLERDAGRPSA
jgi:glycosyltransferase involved in cell wall biosynthesis